MVNSLRRVLSDRHVRKPRSPRISLSNLAFVHRPRLQLSCSSSRMSHEGKVDMLRRRCERRRRCNQSVWGSTRRNRKVSSRVSFVLFHNIYIAIAKRMTDFLQSSLIRDFLVVASFRLWFLVAFGSINFLEKLATTITNGFQDRLGQQASLTSGSCLTIVANGICNKLSKALVANCMSAQLKG